MSHATDLEFIPVPAERPVPLGCPATSSHTVTQYKPQPVLDGNLAVNRAMAALCGHLGRERLEAADITYLNDRIRDTVADLVQLGAILAEPAARDADWSTARMTGVIDSIAAGAATGLADASWPAPTTDPTTSWTVTVTVTRVK